MKLTTSPAETSYPSKKRSYSQRSYLQPIQGLQGDTLGQIDSKQQGRQTQKMIVMRGNSWLKQYDSEQNHRIQQHPLCRPLSSSHKEQQMLLKSFDLQYNKKIQQKKHNNPNLHPLISKQTNMESAFETPKFSFGSRPGPAVYSSKIVSYNNSPRCNSQSPRDNYDSFNDIHFSFGKNIMMNEEFNGSSQNKRNNDFTVDIMDDKYNSKILIESQQKDNNSNSSNWLSQTPSFQTENIKPMIILREKPFIKPKVSKNHTILLKTIKQQYKQQDQLQISSKPAYNFYNFLDKENILLPVNSHQNIQHKAFPKKQQFYQQQQHQKLPGFGRQGLICQLQKNHNNNNNHNDTQSTGVNSRQRTAQSLSFDGGYEDDSEFNSFQPSPLNLTFDAAEEKTIKTRGIYIKTLRNTISKQPKNIQIMNPRIATIL